MTWLVSWCLKTLFVAHSRNFFLCRCDHNSGYVTEALHLRRSRANSAAHTEVRNDKRSS
jgi:hypothetical protein